MGSPGTPQPTVADRIEVRVIHNEHRVVTSHLLDLGDHLDGTADGAIVAIPNENVMLFHEPRDRSADVALSQIVAATPEMFDDSPTTGISPHTYTAPPERLMRLDADLRSRCPTPVTQRIAVTLLALVLIACGGPGDSSPTFCDGISSEFGGCDEDRPSYAGQTCEEIGREFGAQLNERSLEIFNGPDDPEASRAVRAWQLTVVVAQLANKQLRDLGIVDECEADVFLAAAEPEFSAEFKDQAGTYLYDGPPVTYEEWRSEIHRLVAGLIDEEEDVPYDGSPITRPSAEG